jgi:hypothetical protein
MKLLKFFAFLTVFCITYIYSVNHISAQSCIGWGVCCRINSFACIRKTLPYYSYGVQGCNASNIGTNCYFNLGNCRCTSEYTRACNIATCHPNACASGDYLIDDFCVVSGGCSPVNGGWTGWSG